MPSWRVQLRLYPRINPSKLLMHAPPVGVTVSLSFCLPHTLIFRHQHKYIEQNKSNAASQKQKETPRFTMWGVCVPTFSIPNLIYSCPKLVFVPLAQYRNEQSGLLAPNIYTWPSDLMPILYLCGRDQKTKTLIDCIYASVWHLSTVSLSFSNCIFFYITGL